MEGRIVWLIDKEDLYPQHSRFFLRLAMTFDHGDYSAVDVPRYKDRLVETLYRQSLNYYPNAEASLGLGILHQKRGAHRDAVDILLEGLSHFPDDARLNICLGAGLMNLADYDQALARFLEFPDEKDAVHFAARCYEALDALPANQRLAWILRHVEGESLAVVASRCECSLASAKRHIGRAHKRLQEVGQ